MSTILARRALLSPRDWWETGWRSPAGERRPGGTLSLPCVWLHTAHGIPTTHICGFVLLLTWQQDACTCYCWLPPTSQIFKQLSLSYFSHFRTSSLHPDILLVCSLLLYFSRWILLCSTKDLKQLVAGWNVCPSLYGPLGMCDVGFSGTPLCAGAGGHSWAENTLSTRVSRVTLIY